MDDLAPDLVVTVEGPVWLIELNRPEQRNAASEALHTCLLYTSPSPRDS